MGECVHQFLNHLALSASITSTACPSGDSSGTGRSQALCSSATSISNHCRSCSSSPAKSAGVKSLNNFVRVIYISSSASWAIPVFSSSVVGSASRPEVIGDIRSAACANRSAV